MSTTVATKSSPVRSTSTALAWFAWATLGFMILVVLWGAVVRATGSGAGCGDNWPLCNGDFVPHHPRLATIIEFTHRSMTGICTAMVLALAAWTFATTTPRHRARRAVVWSMVLLVTEALLGALLVLRGYVEKNASLARVAAQVVHFTNTFMLLAALSLTAWFLSRRNPGVRPDSARPCSAGARRAVLLAAAATVVMGATGSLAALADTIFPSASLAEALARDFAASSPMLIRMRWIHPAAALLGVASVLYLVAEVRSRMSLAVAGFLLLQLLIGLGDLLSLASTTMQVLHLLGADLFWVALVGLAGEILWPDTLASA